MIEPLPAPRDDARLYLSALRAATRGRNQRNGRRHYCHLREFRPHFLSRIKQLRDYLRGNE